MIDRLHGAHRLACIVLLSCLPLGVAFAQAVPPTSAVQADPATVVVSRGGVSITLSDVDAFMQRVPKEQREKFIDSPARIIDLLTNLLLTRQLAEQARAEHLDQKPDVAAQVRAAQDEVLARFRMKDFMDSIKVPNLDELIAEQYATHKDQYRIPASVDVKHVLIATEKHSDEEAKALAEKVHAEAVAHPKQFDDLVNTYSEDSSKSENHGLMKDAGADKYQQSFREAAAALTRVGEVSPVIKTTYGYHVLELVAKHPARQQSLAEVRDEVRASMREQYIANQRRDFINGLNNMKADINSPTMDSLRDRYDASGNVRVAGPAPTGDGPLPAPAPPAQKPR